MILGVYLFVTFGNGFRFGRLYLHVCQVLGFIGFAVVLFWSPFWSQHVAIGVGFLIAQIVLPFYVGVLAERINEARNKADEANQAKGRFLANVSHEMRTPLNGVLAMADILRETTLTEAQIEIVEMLATSAQMLLTQIEDVLDIAKIEAGRVAIESKPFELGKLLVTAVKIVVPQARFKGLAVATEISEDVKGWFVGDSHHLRQVILNLLSNAIKFTDSGTVTLRAWRVAVATGELRVRVEVEDTGIGIPADKQAVIFEAFAQADDSITRIYGGTGLGTTIAKQLVLLMGGDIGVRSAVGVGSTFYFEIPMHETAPKGEDALDARLAPTKHIEVRNVTHRIGSTSLMHVRGARILVAEDNPTNQRVTQMILESGGHSPTIVSNGESALDELEKGQYDLALFDLSMPHRSGLEALRAYRMSSKKPIPIIILSANVTSDITAECQRAGAAEFMAKPVRASLLLDAIDRHLTPLVPADVRRGSSDSRNQAESATLTVVDIPIVDEAVLAGLAKLSKDPSFVERLLTGFRSDAERLCAQILDALSNHRYEDLKDAAHALRGGAASVGAKQLMVLAQRMENSDHEKLKLQMLDLRHELLQTTSAALEALRTHTATQARGHKAS